MYLDIKFQLETVFQRFHEIFQWKKFLDFKKQKKLSSEMLIQK